ncbi:hypothetical protein KSP40_PGU010882 [Platanthera guangdongensis]|uniref:Poly(A) polymerase nucleotidyltransferase domain-containing protein n=1 Tax=Platanthera guangdongensis TaxID=2320717 RepID=A0ABR2LKV8_9ASPA
MAKFPFFTSPNPSKPYSTNSAYIIGDIQRILLGNFPQPGVKCVGYHPAILDERYSYLAESSDIANDIRRFPLVIQKCVIFLQKISDVNKRNRSLQKMKSHVGTKSIARTIQEPDDFIIVLRGMLQSRSEVSELHCVKTSKVPLMRFKFNGVSIDFPYA